MSSMPYLTIKELKEKIKDLPDEMPVYYQRIEDHYFTQGGWDSSTKTLLWERSSYGDDYNEYVGAFSAYKHPDDYVFVINAHY